jgi:uncharacterized protein YcbK (DUF882 family)
MALPRRSLLFGAAALGAAGQVRAEILDEYGLAEPAPPPAVTRALAAPERFIWARNMAGEEVATAYRAGQDYDIRALLRLRLLFRDLREGAQGPIPPLLVDMISLVQEQWGYTRPIIVHSGFRTPRTNASLEGAAPASQHLFGRALDFTVPGITLGQLGLAAWTLSQRLGFMGIGIYGTFLHVDIGPQRAWTRFGRG